MLAFSMAPYVFSVRPPAAHTPDSAVTELLSRGYPNSPRRAHLVMTEASSASQEMVLDMGFAGAEPVDRQSCENTVIQADGEM